MRSMTHHKNGYQLYNETRLDGSPPWERLPASAKDQWERNAIEFNRKVLTLRVPRSDT